MEHIEEREEQHRSGKLWVRQEGRRTVIGLTEEAADDYGMILFVELPEPGETIKAGRVFLVIETATNEYELTSPVSGTVLDVNRQVETQPDLIHRSPEALGWLVALEQG